MMKGEKPSRKPGLQKGGKGGAAQRREDQETVKYKGGIWLGFMKIYYLERLQMAQVVRSGRGAEQRKWH